MRGATDRTEERRTYAGSSSLTALATHLGKDPESWLHYALEPLPETFRISLHRHDRDWTVEQVKALGAEPLSWMPDETAFVMPFARGRAPDGLAQRMMALLHETGRITRQEAASMLPVRLLNLTQETLALDMCAAPGSKATQLAEELHPQGVVVANEPVSGRLNMLVSNRSRLGLANMVVTQHDGRHFGRLPPPGFDAIVADVPCTGSATTRKNRDVWWDWTPKEGRRMFKMQVDIAMRGAALLAAGGHMVYSTCSIDPIENEAVVAELLRRCPYLELLPIDDAVYPGLVMHPGLDSWPLLDENGAVVDEVEAIRALPFFSNAHLPPALQSSDDSETEQVIAAALKNCRRLWPMDNDTGGFFLALFQHRPEASPKGIAQAYRSKREREPGWEPKMRVAPKPTVNSVILAEDAIKDHVMELYGMDAAPYSIWQRGKRMNLAPPMVKTRLYDQTVPTNKGECWPAGTFHPMRVVHVGIPAFTLKKDSWRSRQEALYMYGKDMKNNVLDVPEEVFIKLLRGWAPLLEEFSSVSGKAPPPAGAYLIRASFAGEEEIISVWVGARITLMIDTNEQNILRHKGSLPWRDEEE